MRVRIIEYRVEEAGFRTTSVTLATTLLDPNEYPAEALTDLYVQRWLVEGYFRDIKTTLGMDVLRCKSVEMVRKEIEMQKIAYNLIRIMMQRSAITHEVVLRRISFKGTLDGMLSFLGAFVQASNQPHKRKRLHVDLLLAIASSLVPDRPGRSEPRARKRRPKNYQHLTKPRREIHLNQRRNIWKKHPAKSGETGLT
jgi:hypothetical protein